MKKRTAFYMAFFIALLTGAALFAEVPNRLTYQGRLARRGVSLSGDHIFVARILDQDGKQLWSSGNITQKLPITGDFALVLEPTGIDWLNVKPSLEISIDGEKFTPNEPFAASPYANAAAIAATVPDGAITNAKLASNLNLSPSKVAISGSTTLADWIHPTATTKINADMIQGTVMSAPDQITGTALVQNTNVTQTLQPTAAVTALVIKPFSTGDVLELRSAADAVIMHVSSYSRVGLGTTEPEEALHIYNGNLMVSANAECEISQRHTGIANSPTFKFGRMVLGGDGSPNFRILYADMATPEKVVFSFDNKGIFASVKTSVGAHFEGFIQDDVNPLFRLNSWPKMQLEMGPGGNTKTDVAVRRETTKTMTFLNGDDVGSSAVERMRLDEFGDLIMTTVGRGVVLKSPDGNCHRLTVDNTGTVASTSVSCP